MSRRGNFFKTFLPIGRRPHPIWTSCCGSQSAVKAATVQARILSGRYRDDLFVSRYSQGDGSCSFCSFYPGDYVHLLSGTCPSLAPALKLSLQNSIRILSDWPLLLSPVLSSLSKSPEEWAQFVVHPTVNSEVIRVSQELGEEATYPLYKFCRAYIWCMHRTRSILLSDSQ